MMTLLYVDVATRVVEIKGRNMMYEARVRILMKVASLDIAV